MPPSYLKICSLTGSTRSSRNTISRFLLRNAISRSRSSNVCARNSSSSMIEGSGQNVADALERSGRLAAVDESLNEPAAVAFDLEVEAARQRVHNRDADTVQTAGD